MSMNNPYAWNAVDPDLCYGRDSLLTDLLNGLAENPRYSYGLAGGRRMGKTTVLRRVERDLQERIERWRNTGLLVISVYVDGLTLPRPLTEDDIWGTILRRLQALRPGHDGLHNLAQTDFEVFKDEISKVVDMVEEQVAPIEHVQSETGFQLEQGQKRPTRRQRVRYVARTHYSGERVKEIASDYDLVETLSEQLSMVVTRSYGRASGQTHTTATREQAYRALKQWESIFAQLIPFSENT